MIRPRSVFTFRQVLVVTRVRVAGGSGVRAGGVRKHRPAADTAIPWPRATLPRIPSRDVAKRRREGIPHLHRDAHDPGPHGHGKAATSSKSTAVHPAGTLKQSGRQHGPAGTAILPALQPEAEPMGRDGQDWTTAAARQRDTICTRPHAGSRHATQAQDAKRVTRLAPRRVPTARCLPASASTRTNSQLHAAAARGRDRRRRRAAACASPADEP